MISGSEALTANMNFSDSTILPTTEDHHDDDHEDHANEALAAIGMVFVGAFTVVFSIGLMTIGFFFSERKRRRKELEMKHEVVDYLSKLTTNGKSHSSQDRALEENGHNQNNEVRSGNWGKLFHKLQAVSQEQDAVVIVDESQSAISDSIVDTAGQKQTSQSTAGQFPNGKQGNDPLGKDNVREGVDNVMTRL